MTALPPHHDYTLSDFDFELPPELIAQHPAAQRSSSRLLDTTGPALQDRVFHALPGLLQSGDLLVFNDTQVIKARLHGAKASGGSVEALVERLIPHTHEVWAHLRASKSPKAGATVYFHNPAGERFAAEVLGRCGPEDSLFHLRLPEEPLALLDRFGHVPLPPYITHDDSADDLARYQTVFASKPGAVAAPTAALHFDSELLNRLRLAGVNAARVTLHVGAGTFQPVRVERLAEHQMHSEWFEVPESTVSAIQTTRARGGRVVSIGTTTLRALESAARSGTLQSGAQETRLFITPGYNFQVVDRLVTNFHLPKSTLLMLVSAFAGYGLIRQAYVHAIAQGYRFFSYGDAMLLDRLRA
jgi:S-adenosylmethionine:tRNA ribosyltransferase-isomerase